MNAQEFSDQFDVLYNNITSNQAPGLTEYEKGIFLTKAQDEILKNYFLPQSNSKQAGYDDNQKRQIDFSMLTKVETLEGSALGAPGVFDTRSNSVNIDTIEDVMMFINETVTVTRGGKTLNLVVVPIRFDEYSRLMSKPYKRPLKYQAWRLISDSSQKSSCDLIVGPSDTITKYIARYIRRPNPIIVGDLDGLTINGCYLKGGTSVTGAEAIDGGCELDPILHEEILQRAVELAKVAWTTTGQDNLQSVIQAGQRSE